MLTTDKIIVKCTTFKCIKWSKNVTCKTTFSITTFKCTRNNVIRGNPFINGFKEIFTVSSKSLI